MEERSGYLGDDHWAEPFYIFAYKKLSLDETFY